MAEYRFYLLDQRQVTVATRELTFDSDAAAMAEASTLRVVCHVVEVWTGPKLVARVLSPEAMEMVKKQVVSHQGEPSVD